MNWSYMQPVRIHFGNGYLEKLGEVIDDVGGRRGLLVTSSSFVKRGIVDEVLKLVKGRIVCVYSEVQPNPDVLECECCIELIGRNDCDFIVALGGGSVIDCAKAASCMAKRSLPASSYLDDPSLLPGEHLPLVAIPTTAGTGSEITCVSVISDHRRGLKKPLASNAFYPAVALVDPELTYTLPPHMSAVCGMDVLCHAIEAYWSVHHQPICDTLACHALRLVFRYLASVVEEKDNLEARDKMAEASLIAGLAFTIPKTTSCHACSYPLTNLLGIAHGEACALTVDYFLEINAREDDGRLASLAAMLGFASISAMVDEIRALKERIGIMKDLRSFGIKEGDERFEALIEGSLNPSLGNNPVKITERMLRSMYSLLI